jgi:hypothetical protein
MQNAECRMKNLHSAFCIGFLLLLLGLLLLRFGLGFRELGGNDRRGIAGLD